MIEYDENGDEVIMVNPSFTPAEDVLNAFAARLGVPIVSKGSGRGWSMFSDMQQCWWKYYQRHVIKAPPRIPVAKDARDVGSIWHAFAAVYYYLMMRGELPSSVMEYALAKSIKRAQAKKRVVSCTCTELKRRFNRAGDCPVGTRIGNHPIGATCPPDEAYSDEAFIEAPKAQDLVVQHPRLEELRDELLARNCNPEAVHEAWRIWDAYTWKYQSDYLIPLAIERHLCDRQTGFTTRFDLLARVDEPPAPNLPGTYIVEHKTAGRFDEQTVDGWDIDGEILGEIAFYERNNLAAKYGVLRGVIVNVAGKQKDPQFHRAFVPVSAFQYQRHVKDLRRWQIFEAQNRRLNTWPRSTRNCFDRYGKCEYYDDCRLPEGK